MADGTKIEWTDATWNVVNGCSVVSPGCTNCYAMRLAGTRLKHHPSRAGLTIDTKAGPVWTGEARFNEAVLLDPLKWERPRRIFVCAHGDLFHDGVPDAVIDQVFAVMSLAPRHVFQVLTKRPDRMQSYISARPQAVWDRIALAMRPAALAQLKTLPWPLPHVWLGVSAEDQKRHDERVWHLRRTPAAVRWLSCEPLLGPIDLGSFGFRLPEIPPSENYRRDFDRSNAIHWVVAGGESGPGARPMNPQWARDLRDQCVAAGVPFLFKQWGEWVSVSEVAAPQTGWHTFHDHRSVRRVGKKRAGRHLDGQLHDEFPA